jgi:hypothetical protein
MNRNRHQPQEPKKQIEQKKEPVFTGRDATTSHKADVRAGEAAPYSNTSGIPAASPIDELPPSEVSAVTEEELDKIKAKALPQSVVVKTTPLEQAIEQEIRAKTTIQISGENRILLEDLKKDLGQDDMNSVISVLIEQFPGRKSTNSEVTLVMSRQKLDWLLAFQSNSDCSATLKASVR